MKEIKMFHIACLISVGKDGNEFEEVEIVHENWVTQDRKSCHFPPFMRNQLKKAIKKAMPPSSDWKMYEMKILNSYGTYDEALSVAELMSKLDSSDDEMPRKKQKISENKESPIKLREVAVTLNKNLPSSAVDADEDSDNSNSPIERSRDIDNLLQMTQTSSKLNHNVAKTSDKPFLLKLTSSASQNPSFLKTITLTPSLQLNNLVSSSSYNTSHSKTNHLVTSSNNRSSLLNYEASPSSQSLPTSSSKNIMEIPSQKKVLDWMEEMDERLKKIDQDNARILASLTTNSNEDCENAIRNRPLRDQNEFADFEQYLADDNNSRKKMDSVQTFLKDCFKNQPDELYENVFKALSKAGVETFEDLKYLDTEKDLDGILKPIQARKLKAKIDEAFSSQINAIKLNECYSLAESPSFENPSGSLQESPVRNFAPVFGRSSFVQSPSVGNSTGLLMGSSLQNFPPAISRNLDFVIPYNKFPTESMYKLERGERPTPSERRHIVRTIVTELTKVVSAPRKSHLEPIAKEIVGKYPHSLSDCIGETVIGEGHSSFLLQLIQRTENVRKDVRRTLKRSMGYADRMNAIVKYGCANYQPEIQPGEIMESLSIKKKTLIEEWQVEVKNISKVDNLMESTYAFQRLDINMKLPITVLKENWPFLFLRKYMLLHAKQLLGFPIVEKFEEAIKNKIPEVFFFLRMAKTKYVRNVDLEHKHLNYIPALAAYFEEDCSVIFKIFEKYKSLDEVQINAPVTPFIACIGNPYQLDPVCTVFVEQVPLEPMIPLNDAIHTWFSSFFVFNQLYPEECCATLEFIQRALLLINPDYRGSRTSKRFGKRLSIHPKVLKLLNKLKDNDII